MKILFFVVYLFLSIVYFLFSILLSPDLTSGVYVGDISKNVKDRLCTSKISETLWGVSGIPKVHKCGLMYYYVAQPQTDDLPLLDAPNYMFNKSGEAVAECGGYMEDTSKICSLIIGCIGENICDKKSETREYCESKGAQYKEFLDTCRDYCKYVKRRMNCRVKTTHGCYCGEGKCWNGFECEKIVNFHF